MQDENKLSHNILLDMQKDIKKLLVEVGILKYKSSIFGMLGGSIIVVAAIISKKIGVL